MWKTLFLIIVISILSWFGYDHYRQNVGKPGLDGRAVISDIQGKFSNLKAMVTGKRGSGDSEDAADDSMAMDNGRSDSDSQSTDSGDTAASSQENGAKGTSESAEAVSNEASPTAKITIVSQETLNSMADKAKNAAEGTSAEATLTLIKKEISVDDSNGNAKETADSIADETTDMDNVSNAASENSTDNAPSSEESATTEENANTGIAMPKVPLTLGALSRQVGSTIGSTQRILEGVTDSESATVAAPKLVSYQR